MSNPRTFIVILDSLSYESARGAWPLIAAYLPNRGFGFNLNRAIAHAPYTPSSITSIRTGLLPFQHDYMNFPPPAPPPFNVNYWLRDHTTEAWWTSTNLQSSYMFENGKAVPFRGYQNVVENSDAELGYFHMWETHIPYGRDESIDECVENMKKLDSREERIRYSHYGLRKALDKLKRLFAYLRPDDRLIITSDHGESWGNPSAIHEDGTEDWMHNRCTLSELVVPFISNIPNVPPVIQHIDIRPTLFGKENCSPDCMGQDFTNLLYKFNPLTSASTSRWIYPEEPRMFVENSVILDNGSKGYPYDSVDDLCSLRIHYGLNYDLTKFVGSNTGTSDDGENRELMDMMNRTLEKLGCMDHIVLGDAESDGVQSDGNTNEAEFIDRLKSLGYLN